MRRDSVTLLEQAVGNSRRGMRLLPLAAAAILLTGGTSAAVMGSMAQGSVRLPEATGDRTAAAERPAPSAPDLQAELPARNAILAGAAGDVQGSRGARDVERRTLKVRPGDVLMGVLKRGGVAPEKAAGALKALRAVWDPRRLRPGQRITLRHRRPADGLSAPRFAGFSLEPERTTRLTVRRRPDGGFHARESRKKLEHRLVRRTGTIRTSLYAAASNADLPPAVLDALMTLYSYKVDFQRDLQPGDRFRVVYKQGLDDDGRICRNGPIIKARMVFSGEPMTAYRYKAPDGDTQYFNARGESVRTALKRTPVDGARISSDYGKRRHPIQGYTRMHTGVDFAVAPGTPIQAAGDGVIEEARWNGGYGRYVEIRHNADFDTAYAHMQRFADGIHPGRRVEQGEIIGYVGSTGRSTGPHLHYEIQKHDKAVNPLEVEMPAGRSLEGKALARFKRQRKAIEKRIARLTDDEGHTKVASRD